jgi:hypothetical protein
VTSLAALACVLVAAPAASAGQSSISVRDPDGGAPWTARVSKAGSRTCVAVSRGADRKPRECERLSRSRVFLYSVRHDTAADPRRSRTIAVAVFGDSVAAARLQSPDGTVTFRRGRRRGAGILLAVIAGRVERPALRVEVRSRGRTRVVRSAPPAGLQLADPQGGAAWKTAAFAASGGRACVRWERVPGRFETPPSPLRGTLRCGPGGADVPVATAERVDGRLVVTGLAGGAASGLVLTGAGEPRPLTVERRSRAFLAVLPGDADPAALRLRYETSRGATRERPLEVAG